MSRISHCGSDERKVTQLREALDFLCPRVWSLRTERNGRHLIQRLESGGRQGGAPTWGPAAPAVGMVGEGWWQEGAQEAEGRAIEQGRTMVVGGAARKWWLKHS